MKIIESLKQTKLTMSTAIVLVLLTVSTFGQSDSKSDELHQELKNGNTEKVMEIIENDISLLESPNRRGSTPIMLAAADGHTEILKFLIKMGGDINKANTFGNTALHYTAWESQTKMFKFLVEKGAHLNVENSRGQNPLQYACMGGSIEIFNYCLSQGMDIDKKGNDGSGLIHWAALGGNLDLFKYLETKGMDYNLKDSEGRTPIFWAARGDKVEVVKYLVGQKKVDVNRLSDKGFSPLKSAVERGRYEAAKYLIEKDADVNLKLEDNTTFLLLAAYNTNFDLVKLLLDKGCEVNVFDDRGNTPLMSASSRGNLEIVKLLIERGAKIEPGICQRETCTNSGSTPLLVAVRTNPEVVKYLLEKGSNINALDHDGDNVVHRMMYSDSLRTLDILCDYGANINLQNKRGETPLITAVKSNKPDLVKALLEKKANIALADNDGKTVLHHASIEGYHNILNILIENGADMDVTDVSGCTPAYYAVYYGHHDIANHLLDKGSSNKNMPYEKTELLSKPLKNGEAVLWYCNHSGWAVKTKNHLLIFDYWQRDNELNSPSINNGRINPDEIENLNVVVFVSHTHGDHFSREILNWDEKLDNISYVFGFETNIDQAYFYIPPRNNKTIDNIKITTIPSTDTGEGFMVEADGVTIYHPGDHANRYQEDKVFSDEIDFLAKNYNSIDIAFIPISGCGFRDKVALNKGNDYLVEKFNPKMVIPMHGYSSGYKYKEYASEKNKAGNTSIYKYVLNKGDRLLYSSKNNNLGDIMKN